MSDFNRTMAKEMAKFGGKFMVGKNFGTISPDIEWIKWLSYESKYERERMEYFDSKKVSELTYEELEEASKYTRNKIFAKLFEVYGTSECSYEDYMKVYDYMSEESIDELMLSKLTYEELENAKEGINRFSKLSKLETNILLNKYKENYESLSMVDAYIMHVISEIDYKISLNELNSEINEKIEQNNAMMQKSLSNASKNII